MTTIDALRAAGFSDPADYIEKITYAIWNPPGRDPGLIDRWYAPDSVVHADWGDLRGADALTRSTEARLLSYPDFAGSIDDTIWTVGDDGAVRTSMRWCWQGTDTGGTVFGPATGRQVTHLAIAECVVEGTQITREWLGTDMSGLATQLGVDPIQAQAALLPARSPSGPDRYVGHLPFATDGAAGELVGQALEHTLAGGDPARFLSDDCSTATSGIEIGSGPDIVRDWAAALSQRGAPTLVFHDQYAQDAADGSVRVATRGELRLAGGGGDINLVCHHHVLDGRITAQWLLADRLAALASG